MINHEERAARAWDVLVDRAKLRKTITYGELGAALHIHQRVVRFALGPIQDFCMAERRPPLTILVVQRAARRPGAGFIAWDVDDIETGQKQVFDFPWRAIENPFRYALETGATIEQLADRIVADPAHAEDVYRLVRARGVAQLVFRSILRTAYGDSCAFCGFSFPVALESAHIVGWADAAPAERLDPRNGLLLCSTHHRLFDAGVLVVAPDMTLRRVDAQYVLEEYSRYDRLLTEDLAGRRIRLPDEPQLRPSPEYFKRRARGRTTQ